MYFSVFLDDLKHMNIGYIRASGQEFLALCIVMELIGCARTVQMNHYVEFGGCK